MFAANNAEMRAGSGMLLSAGELETGPEGVRLNSMRSVTDISVPPGAVPMPREIADRWGWLTPNVEWRNLLTSPRFDAAAQLASQMWVAAGNRPVDGVMVLDPVSLGAIISATGPVQVDGRTLDEQNVQKELLHDQYLRFTGNETPERREQLGLMAQALFGALDAGSWSLPRLATGLGSAVGGRHILLWSADAVEQTGWTALGVDGSLSPNSLLVSVVNRGGNKLDYFLDVNADISVRAAGSDSEVAVSLRLKNLVPTGEPRYIAGPQETSGVEEGVYLGIVTVNMPGRALDAHFDGVESLAVQGPDGPSHVIGFQLEIPRGGERTVVARFRLPGERGDLRIEPSARVPPIDWVSGATTWIDKSARVLTWSSESVGK